MERSLFKRALESAYLLLTNVPDTRALRMKDIVHIPQELVVQLGSGVCLTHSTATQAALGTEGREYVSVENAPS